ncbi:hypothetical protein BDN71DRAFT_1511104 [Pleurotus eryngii]|uniref:Uncharacterized protein n=1 Tax=Pleurotus eryngii TaxID=5323 RepID=A0A9P6D315_PLEER|nr:hypothetical protein BDN71DRAFT_1511104 [Pleurotus eryngii]
MPMNTIPLFSYEQLNAGPLGLQAAAWERRIPSQLIVDYADHWFLDILLAMRRSWDTVPIALLRRELEYILGTIGASVALGHIVTPGPIVRALAKGLEEDLITPASFQDSRELGKALNLARINCLKQANQPLAHRHAWWETAASHRAAEADRNSPSPHILSALTIIQCLEAWGEQQSESEGLKNIPLYKDGDGVHRPLSLLMAQYAAQATILITSPPCDRCIERLDIITQMMSTLEVVTNDRMMDVAAHGQEAAALFDIYEAVIYKEADNADKAEMQQNATELDAEIQRILDDNQPAPEHANRKKATKAMEDLRRKNHALIDLINKVARQSLKAIPNQTNAFWSEGPDLSLEEVFAEFRPDSDVGPSEMHDGYFRTLPSGSERSGNTLDQASKIRDAQFPLIFNLQPLTPIQPKDDGGIPHITLANRPHDRLVSVFRTPKLSDPLAEMTGFAALDRAQSSLRRSEPTIPHHNSLEYVPSGSDTPKPPIIPVVDVLESNDDSFQSLGGTLSSIVGKKLAIGQASAQPLAGSASGSDASLGGQSAMEYEPNKSVAASDDEASLGGQSTEDPSSDNEMADDESMEENTPGVDLSHHRQHTPPAEREAEDDEDDAMSLGGYTDDEADNSHAFSMVEMQANISNIPSSPEVGRMGSPVEVDDAYSEYLDDSNGDVDIPDDVQAYLQASHTPGFQSRYQHVHFEHIPDAEFADDVL